MTGPKVSVIVPVYNAADYLPRCLDSLRAQSLSEIEIILVNDGSTDGSGELLCRETESDPRFCIIHQENQGAAAARYAGMQKACGEYVGFVDADDYVEPEMYARMYGEARTAQADLVMCGYWEHMGGERTIHHVRAQRLVIDGPNAPMEAYVRCVAASPSLCNKLYSRRLIGCAQRPLPIKIGEDLALCVALAPYVRRAVSLPEAFYHYVIYDNSAIHQRRRLDGEINPLDQFLTNIAGEPAYDVPGNRWKYMLAAQSLVNTFYTNYSYGQGIGFFYSQLRKLREWPLFSSFCGSVVSDRCLKPLREAGGVSARLSVGMRAALLTCLLGLDRLSAALLTVLRRLLEAAQAIRSKRIAPAGQAITEKET